MRNLTNILMSQNNTTPTEGGLATVLRYSDRQVYFVNSVSQNGKQAIIERARPVRIDSLGMTDAQQYSYERVPNQVTEEIKFSRGKWRKVYTNWEGKKTSEPISIIFDIADEHYDYSF